MHDIETFFKIPLKNLGSGLIKKKVNCKLLYKEECGLFKVSFTKLIALF